MRPNSHDQSAGQTSNGPVIVHVSTVSLTLWAFHRARLSQFREMGYQVHAVASPDDLLARLGEVTQVSTHGIALSREMTPLRDLVSLGRLFWLFRELRPALVHAHTPKAGLLAMLAAWLAGVRVRVYHCLGLPLATASGPKRWLLAAAETLTCLLAGRVYCVSHSLREELLASAMVDPGKVAVLANGGSVGVDAETRFRPDAESRERGRRMRERLGVPPDARTIGFIGRLVRDKGLGELTAAWATLRARYPDLHLIVAGPAEKRDSVPSELVDRLSADDRVRMLGFVDDTVALYGAMDVFVLPTYREGLSNVLLEAGAMSLPVVASAVTGCVDCVRDGETGTLVPARDAAALTEAVAAYMDDPAKRRCHGEAARMLVLERFQPGPIFEALCAEYDRLLAPRVAGARSSGPSTQARGL